MGQLINKITINAPLDKIWAILTDLESLEKTDPTVKKVTLISDHKIGLDAKRKVLMQDGKNWFDEKITTYKVNETLSYELTACSFPIKDLKHTYSFEKVGDAIQVQQIMDYTVKFGVLGKLMDKMMIGKQFNEGIGKFMQGLKSFAEQ